MTSMTDQSIPLGFVQNLVLRTRPVVYRIGEVEGEFKGNCQRKHRQRLKTIVNTLVRILPPNWSLENLARQQ